MNLRTPINEILDGLWAMHPASRLALSDRQFSKHPQSFIRFQGSHRWRLYRTGNVQRLGSADMSTGIWRVYHLEGLLVLVLDVEWRRPAKSLRAVYNAITGDENINPLMIPDWALPRTAAGKVSVSYIQMFFMLIHVKGYQEITVSPASSGKNTRLQRWRRIK